MIRLDPAVRVGSPAIGLSAQVGKATGVSVPPLDPYPLPDIPGVLAYDLTDATTMSVERDGAVGVPGVGTLVGRVESVGTLKVPLIASADSARPTRRDGHLEWTGDTLRAFCLNAESWSGIPLSVDL